MSGSRQIDPWNATVKIADGARQERGKTESSVRAMRLSPAKKEKYLRKRSGERAYWRWRGGRGQDKEQ